MQNSRIINMLPVFQMLQTTDEMYHGRVGYDSLSQQILLELVVEELVDDPPFAVDSGCFNDISTWKGVSCDEKGHVTNIDWSSKFDTFFPQGGVIKMEWLPSSLRVFDIYRNALRGSVDLSILPRDMQIIDLTENQLTGSLNLRQLPKLLEVLDLACNTFSGWVDLTTLTSSLRVLDISHNKLTGRIKCTGMPPNMNYIRLQDNLFHGDLLLDDSACHIQISLYETSIGCVQHINGSVDFYNRVIFG